MTSSQLIPLLLRLRSAKLCFMSFEVVQGKNSLCSRCLSNKKIMNAFALLTLGYMGAVRQESKDVIGGCI